MLRSHAHFSETYIAGTYSSSIFVHSPIKGKAKSIPTTDEVYTWKVETVEGAELLLLKGGFERQGSELVWSSSPTALQELISEIEHHNNALVQKIRN